MPKRPQAKNPRARRPAPDASQTTLPAVERAISEKLTPVCLEYRQQQRSLGNLLMAAALSSGMGLYNILASNFGGDDVDLEDRIKHHFPALT